ncbi:G antigen 2D-like [Zootermopsis nevadensis]|uniref:G antigen 2D-like n=1 Tax=Zootermopsis nevadensis TaxID=136037 RepID=UPI000B8E7678|nr:G antigen 2D-like [Zootermopsis nevadensis]
MPGGGKKAVFPTLALHDHEKVRATANEQDRQKKFHQSRGKSESKDSPEKEKSDPPKAKPVKTPPKGEPGSKCTTKELQQ